MLSKSFLAFQLTESDVVDSDSQIQHPTVSSPPAASGGPNGTLPVGVSEAGEATYDRVPDGAATGDADDVVDNTLTNAADADQEDNKLPAVAVIDPKVVGDNATSDSANNPNDDDTHINVNDKKPLLS